MRLVPNAVTFPSRCAAIPFIGTSHEKGYVDTGSEIHASARDSHVYVSVVAVEEMARLIGWTPPDEAAASAAVIAEQAARIESLEGEVAQADRFLNAIDALESADFRARKKPGRPKKTDEVAA